MTKITKENVVCHVCRKEYEALMIYSWNSTLSGMEIPEKPSCPHCGAMYKRKITPSIGTAKDILMKMLTNADEASEDLVKYSIEISDLKRWEEVMKNMDYKAWENNNNKKKEMVNIKEIVLRKELKDLKDKEEIDAMIDRLIDITKEKINKKNKYE